MCMRALADTARLQQLTWQLRAVAFQMRMTVPSYVSTILLPLEHAGAAHRWTRGVMSVESAASLVNLTN